MTALLNSVASSKDGTANFAVSQLNQSSGGGQPNDQASFKSVSAAVMREPSKSASANSAKLDTEGGNNATSSLPLSGSKKLQESVAANIALPMLNGEPAEPESTDDSSLFENQAVVAGLVLAGEPLNNRNSIDVDEGLLVSDSVSLTLAEGAENGQTLLPLRSTVTDESLPLIGGSDASQPIVNQLGELDYSDLDSGVADDFDSLKGEDALGEVAIVETTIPKIVSANTALHSGVEGDNSAVIQTNLPGASLPKSRFFGTGLNSVEGAVANVGLGNSNSAASSASGMAEGIFGFQSESPSSNLATGAAEQDMDGQSVSLKAGAGDSMLVQAGKQKNSISDEFAKLKMASLEDGMGEKLSSVKELDTTHASIREIPLQATSAASGRMQIPINISFSRPEWSGMVAERTAMMAAQNISVADMQLDPPELGPMQVKVSVTHDQASVSFVVANPAVRESLDQSLARLRELFASQGLDLVNVDVSDQQQFSKESDENQGNSLFSGNTELVDESLEAPVAHSVSVSYGIDSYA